MKVLTTTGHEANVGCNGVRWRGHLHLHYVGERGDPRRKLSQYEIDGVPADVAHVRQDVVRGPWIVHIEGIDLGTARTKSDAQREVKAWLGL